MKAVLLPDYNPNVLRAMLSLRVEEIQSPVPGKNEVVVRLYAAACNPSDIAFIRGGYNIIKPVPAIPGFEASGKVIAAGSKAQNLLGKNVSCFVQSDDSGTWAEEFVAHINDLVVLDEKMDFNQGAAFSVNPFTAQGLIDIAKHRESKAIVQNAGGGQVAEFIRRLAEENNIDVINIVRKEETVDSLKRTGEKYVLYEQETDFFKKLKSIAIDLNATTAFDAVGGELAGTLFNAMPKNAELVVYGGLSGKRISGVNEMDLIFKEKRISGFNLINWKETLDQEEFKLISETLQEKFISGKLKTEFQATTNLDTIVDGLKTYIKNMSSGKLLIKP